VAHRNRNATERNNKAKRKENHEADDDDNIVERGFRFSSVVFASG
jgi:hypothetical protein